MNKKQERIAEYNNKIRNRLKGHGTRHFHLDKGKSDYVCRHCEDAAKTIGDCNNQGEQMLSLQEGCIIDPIIKMAYWVSPSTIRSLNLRFNCIETPAIRFLAKIEWPFLHSLILEGNFIDSEGAQLIARSNFQKLSTLILSQNMIMYEGQYLLTKANFAKSLSRLKLRRIGLLIENPIPNQMGNFVNLLQLDLQNPLSRKAVKTMISISLKVLTNLDLTSCKIDDEGATELSKGKWTGLSMFDIKSNSITNRGMHVLVSGSWPQLRQFSATLEGNFMTMFRIIAKTNSPFKIQCNIAHSEPYREAIDAYLLDYKCLNKKLEFLQY